MCCLATPNGSGYSRGRPRPALTKMLDETKDAFHQPTARLSQKSLSAIFLVVEVARHPGVLALS